MAQHYGNHRKYYPLHHFVLLPVVAISTLYWLWNVICCGSREITSVFLLLFSVLSLVVLMMRQHYALILQNRIVRLEMRVRWFQLTGERLEPYEEKLGFGRIAALRFASDEELSGLLHRALDKGLSADEIKKAITSWQADEMRV